RASLATTSRGDACGSTCRAEIGLDVDFGRETVPRAAERPAMPFPFAPAASSIRYLSDHIALAGNC
ncbi:MAG: hypothetical protein ACP5M5_13445, partial [Acidibrevibacterium sp.]|uniref:hypothetical protein n=1 Tax=Acidibrevibacterium sp. TaxID=2606776 RepID=UPI003D0008AE